MKTFLGKIRSLSQVELNSKRIFYEGGVSDTYTELVSELKIQKVENENLKRRCSELTNSVWTLELALKQRSECEDNTSIKMQPVEEDEVSILKRTLDEYQLERQELLLLIQRLQSEDPLEKRQSQSWYRRPSVTSSYLYAGVEANKGLEPSTIDVQVETETNCDTNIDSTFRILPALTMLTVGTWLYKYPRRQYSKLMSQETVPVGQLSYRYFFILPSRMLICWSTTDTHTSDGLIKSVQIRDFYTEHRLLPLGNGNGQEREKATIIIVLTEQENPLTIVPVNSEDLSTWLNGLRAMVKMRSDPAWPQNIALAAVEPPTFYAD